MATSATPPARRRPWCCRTVVAGLVLLGAAVLLVLLPAGQRAEQLAASAVTLPWPRSIPVYHLLSPVGPPLVVGVLVASVVIALARRRADLAVTATVAVAGANVLTAVVKRLLVRPEHGMDAIGLGNTTPSGHTTAALSFAVALLVVLPRAFRLPAAALGAAGTTAAGLGMLVTSHHRPGDILGALGIGLLVLPPAVASGYAVRLALDRTALRPVVVGRSLGTEFLRSSWAVRPWAFAAASVFGTLFTVVRIWVYGVQLGDGATGEAVGVLTVALLAGATAATVTIAAHVVDRHA